MNIRTAMICANGKDVTISLPFSIADFVQQSGWKVTQVVVEHNGSVLKRDTLAQVQLNDGDRIEIITPVAGG